MRLIFAIFILLFSSSVWAETAEDEFINKDEEPGKSASKAYDSAIQQLYSLGLGLDTKRYDSPEERCLDFKAYCEQQRKVVYYDCMSRGDVQPSEEGCRYQAEVSYAVCDWHSRCEWFFSQLKAENQQQPGLDFSQVGINDPESDAFKYSLREEGDEEDYTLIEAISAQLTKKVRSILDDDPDVNTLDNAGNAPLHFATFMWVSERNSYVYVDWLLDFSEIEVNSQNWAGMTALHQAAELNHLGVVDRLLKYPGINARLLNYQSETPLSLALKKDNDLVIQRLIDYFHNRYLARDTLKESKYLWDWASSLLHQSGKLVLFADETITQKLHESWNGWRKHFPKITRELEDWAQATGRVVAFTASEAADGAGYLSRLTLGDSITDGIIECAENTCQAIHENTTPEQRKALLSISVVIAGGPVGKIVSRGARAFRKFPKMKMPKVAGNNLGRIDDSASAATTVGRKGQQHSFPNPKNPRPRNIPGNINGRKYTGHALDRMQERGFTPSVVEDAIKNAIPQSGKNGAKIFKSKEATVILNPDNSVKTVY